METWTQIVHFFNHPIFIIVGGLTVTAGIVGLLFNIVCWAFGISPIVFRLGIALWKRRVAIFGSAEAFASLSDTIINSKIFNTKSIVYIPLDNIDKAKNETIFLVDWDSASEKINQIFDARQNHQTALIIFAKAGSIPLDIMTDIANRANTVVVNFRGRLLNDIVTSLVTTSYKK